MARLKQFYTEKVVPELQKNLVLANPLATFEQVVQACKLAEIHETVEQLPKGYQTPVGEHGAGFSGC